MGSGDGQLHRVFTDSRAAGTSGAAMAGGEGGLGWKDPFAGPSSCRVGGGRCPFAGRQGRAASFTSSRVWALTEYSLHLSSCSLGAV